jgi:hypothetical protein
MKRELHNPYGELCNLQHAATLLVLYSKEQNY